MRIGDSQGSQGLNGSSSSFGVFQWNKTQKELGKVQEKLATGKAVNRASDDAAMMAVIQEFDKQVRAYSTASQNISAGMSVLEISDGGSSAITDMLQRQHDLALQASGGTLNPDQLGAIDREYQALSQEIDRVAASTQFNGQPLLNGQGALANGSAKLQVGPGGGAGDAIQVSASDLTSGSLGTQGTSVASRESAENAIQNVSAALQQVVGNRAERGGLYNRLEYAYSSSENQRIETTRSLSQLQDVDMAKAMTEESRLSILAQSNANALHQFNTLSRTHLLGLLQG
jgi:flagellin